MESLSLETGAAPSREQWEKAAAAVLRKAGRLGDDAADSEVWAQLAQRTLDGIEISPLGTPELVRQLTTSGRPQRVGDWDNRPIFADPDPATTREAILTDLENGATSVWLQLGKYGVPVDALGSVLDGVLLDVAPVVLDCPGDRPNQLAAARAFAEIARGKQLAEGTNLGVDPVGAAVRAHGLPDTGPGMLRGEIPEDAVRRSSREVRPSTTGEAAKLATELGCRALVVDGSVVHDLGGSEVQELGFAMAVAATYLRSLVEAGHDVAAAAALIEFRLAATDEQFPTIAKLRAARRLWARVLELSGGATGSTTGAGPMRIHAVTSRPMISKYDPWVNMLRTCVAAFAAGVGGADVVTVLPFDAALGLPDTFSRRIARNTSSLLLAESHVGAVADPAGGSHLVERLTDDLAVAAWTEFGRIEGDDGELSGLAALGGRIADVVAERDRQIATRKRSITGVSEFPNLAEALPERAPYPEGGLAVKRFGHAFEALRDEPVTQRVFLATMGTVAAHTTRATFATNLFAAGGIDVVNEGAHDDADAVLAHYRGEPVVCLVGSDAAYADWGTELANRLREAGASRVIVAGKPLQGCDDNAAAGIDALDFLRRTRAELEEDK